MENLTGGPSIGWVLLLICLPASAGATGRRQEVKCEELGPDLQNLSRGTIFGHLLVDTQCLKDISPSMTLYTEKHPEGCKLTQNSSHSNDSSCTPSIQEVSNFVFLVHGFLPRHSFLVIPNLKNINEDVWIEEWITMKDKLVKEENTGVVVVNWSRGADVDLSLFKRPTLIEALQDLVNLMPYQQAAANTRYTGAAIAKAMQQIFLDNDKASFHCIGHSLGAHTCGFAGKALRKSTSLTMTRISGLDPARPLFINPSISKAARLNKDDAKMVDVIHSDSHLFGSFKPIGHYDFYPGAKGKFGFDQPGASFLGSHSSAIFMYLSSIGSEACSATKKCSSIALLTDQGCAEIKEGPVIGHMLQPTIATGAFAIEVVNNSLKCFAPDNDRFLQIEEDNSNIKDTLGILFASKVIKVIFDKAKQTIDKELSKIEISIKQIRSGTAIMKENEEILLNSIAIEMDQAKKKLQNIQTKLTILAIETMERSNTLIKYLQRFQKGKTKYLKIILRRVASLLERSEMLLDEASETYKAASTHYINTKATIKQFQNTYLDRLTNELRKCTSDLEYQKTYGRLITGLTIVGCIGGIGYGIIEPGGVVLDVVAGSFCSSISIAGIVKTERTISTLNTDLASIRSALQKSESTIIPIIENVERKQRMLKQEKKIAKKWKEHVTSILTTHEKDLGELKIKEDLMLIADDVIDEFKKLKCHANKYLVYKQCTEDCEDLPVSDQMECIKACKTALKPCTIAEV